jgi:hypothetical protein
MSATKAPNTNKDPYCNIKCDGESACARCLRLCDHFGNIYPWNGHMNINYVEKGGNIIGTTQKIDLDWFKHVDKGELFLCFLCAPDIRVDENEQDKENYRIALKLHEACTWRSNKETLNTITACPISKVSLISDEIFKELHNTGYYGPGIFNECFKEIMQKVVIL